MFASFRHEPPSEMSMFANQLSPSGFQNIGGASLFSPDLSLKAPAGVSGGQAQSALETVVKLAPVRFPLPKSRTPTPNGERLHSFSGDLGSVHVPELANTPHVVSGALAHTPGQPRRGDELELSSSAFGRDNSLFRIAEPAGCGILGQTSGLSLGSLGAHHSGLAGVPSSSAQFASSSSSGVHLAQHQQHYQHDDLSLGFSLPPPLPSGPHLTHYPAPAPNKPLVAALPASSSAGCSSGLSFDFGADLSRGLQADASSQQRQPHDGGGGAASASAARGGLAVRFRAPSPPQLQQEQQHHDGGQTKGRKRAFKREAHALGLLVTPHGLRERRAGGLQPAASAACVDGFGMMTDVGPGIGIGLDGFAMPTASGAIDDAGLDADLEPDKGLPLRSTRKKRAGGGAAAHTAPARSSGAAGGGAVDANSVAAFANPTSTVDVMIGARDDDAAAAPNVGPRASAGAPTSEASSSAFSGISGAAASSTGALVTEKPKKARNKHVGGSSKKRQREDVEHDGQGEGLPQPGQVAVAGSASAAAGHPLQSALPKAATALPATALAAAARAAALALGRVAAPAAGTAKSTAAIGQSSSHQPISEPGALPSGWAVNAGTSSATGPSSTTRIVLEPRATSLRGLLQRCEGQDNSCFDIDVSHAGANPCINVAGVLAAGRLRWQRTMQQMVAAEADAPPVVFLLHLQSIMSPPKDSAGDAAGRGTPSPSTRIIGIQSAVADGVVDLVIVDDTAFASIKHVPSSCTITVTLPCAALPEACWPSNAEADDDTNTMDPWKLQATVRVPVFSNISLPFSRDNPAVVRYDFFPCETARMPQAKVKSAVAYPGEVGMLPQSHQQPASSSSTITQGGVVVTGPSTSQPTASSSAVAFLAPASASELEANVGTESAARSLSPLQPDKLGAHAEQIVAVLLASVAPALLSHCTANGELVPIPHQLSSSMRTIAVYALQQAQVATAMLLQPPSNEESPTRRRITPMIVAPASDAGELPK